MTEPDYDTMPLHELIELYGKMAEEFKKRNKNINYLVDARRAGTLEQKAQGREARNRLMGSAKAEIKRMGKIVKRRLMEEADWGRGFK